MWINFRFSTFVKWQICLHISHLWYLWQISGTCLLLGLCAVRELPGLPMTFTLGWVKIDKVECCAWSSHKEHCKLATSQCCLAGDIAQSCLPGDKVCNFTMNLSSGDPQPILSNVGFGSPLDKASICMDFQNLKTFLQRMMRTLASKLFSSLLQL